MSDNLASQFFEALGQDGPEEAHALLRGSAFQDGIEKAPSPRAAGFVNSGEWDAGELRLIAADEKSTCWGILSDGKIMEGASKMYTRFCCESSVKCTIQSHAKQKVLEASRNTGWYLQAARPSLKGAILDIYFQSKRNGGPVSTSASLRLGGEDPFKMTPGQWLFLADAWASRDVTAVDESLQDTDQLLDSVQETVALQQEELDKIAANREDQNPCEDRSSHPTIDTRIPRRSQAVLGSLADVESLGGESETAEQSREEFLAFLRDFDERLRTVLESNAKLARENAALQRRAQEEARTQANRDQEFIVFKTEYSNLLSRLGALESSDRSASSLPMTPEQAKKLIFEVTDRQGALPVLRSVVQAMRDKESGGGGVDFHGHTWGSSHEFLLWFEHNNCDAACFMDAKALVTAIQPPVVTQMESLKARDAETKTQCTTGLEASLTASFDTLLPPVLVGGKSTIQGGTKESLMAYQKTLEIFDPHGKAQGVKSRVTQGTKKVMKRLDAYRKQGRMTSEALAVATSLSTDGSLFIEGFMTWQSKGSRELADDTTLPPATVWDMTKECEAKVWEDIDSARSMFVDAARAEPGLYVWGMLQAWQVEQRYLENSFQDDPALTGIFVREILFSSEDESLKDKISKFGSFQEKSERLTTAATSDIKKLQTQVKEITKDVHTLKNRSSS